MPCCTFYARSLIRFQIISDWMMHSGNALDMFHKNNSHMPPFDLQAVDRHMCDLDSWSGRREKRSLAPLTQAVFSLRVGIGTDSAEICSKYGRLRWCIMWHLRRAVGQFAAIGARDFT